MALLVSNVAFDPVASNADHLERIAGHLGVAISVVRDLRLVRKSLDARHRKPRWVGVFRVEVADEERLLRDPPSGVRRWNLRDEGRYGLDADAPTPRQFDADVRPIVVGMGPAGMFAAMYLAEAGAPVRVVERGAAVDERIKTVNAFFRRKAELDPETNLVFGEGGAGTFSDGKIYTRRRDGELGYIFRKLVQFGAPEEVLQDAWAHLGTDAIRSLLPPFRRRLEELGAEVHFGRRVTSLIVDGGRCRGVVLDDGTALEGAPVLVGTGHSARDTLEMMVRAGAAARPRGIAIGARVEHPQALIDQGRYGRTDRGELPPASYRLAWHPKEGAAARTFCMCPGGMVVPASNHLERVVVNGMSFAARRSYWANSAVIVEIDPSAFEDTDPMAGFRFQDVIEARAYALGGSTYAAPAQRVVDFLAGRASAEVPRSSYPLGITPVDLHEVLPDTVTGPMKHALRDFDKKLAGFAGGDGVLIAPETRTTSPVRFERTEDLQSVSLPGLVPVGEGAGYAGGIISSALDGLRAARALVAAAPPRGRHGPGDNPGEEAARDRHIRDT